MFLSHLTTFSRLRADALTLATLAGVFSFHNVAFAGATASCNGAVMPEQPPIAVRAPKGKQILFIEFDDVDIAGGGDFAPGNQTGLPGMDGHWTSLGWSEARKQQVVDGVKAHFAPYDIEVTTTRPADGIYSMIVVGQNGSFQNGVATLDCANFDAANVGFVNPSVDDPAADAALIAHEAGHTFGFEHIEWDGGDARYIMHPTVFATSEILTACQPVVAGEDRCAQDHDKVCMGAGQNTHEELLATIGAAGESEGGAPMVTITAPADGANVPSDFTVTATAEDSDGIASVSFALDGSVMASVDAEPYSWSAMGVADGSHTITVTATDGAGNDGSSEISVVVGEGTTSASSTGGGTDTLGDTDGDPGGDDDGGGCRVDGSQGRRGLPAALALVLGFVAYRRRR